MRRVLAVALAPALLAVAATPALAAPTTHREVTESHPTGAVRVVRASSDIGNVVVRAGDRVTVRTVERWNRERPRVRISLTDGVLRVVARCPDDQPLNDCSVDVVVTAPSAAAATLASSTGDLRSVGLSGNQVLTTEVGNAFVDGDAQRVRVQSDTGDVRAVLGRKPTDLDLRTSTGDASAVVPSGRYRLSLSTDTGDTSASGVTDDPTSQRHLALRASTGDVVVRGRD